MLEILQDSCCVSRYKVVKTSSNSILDHHFEDYKNTMVKQLNVWILQTGEPLHTDPGHPRPMRAMNLANALTKAGHNVVLWSSAFYHQEKKHRCHETQCITISRLLEIRLIPSPGYSRNIGFDRLWDHKVLALNLKKLLKQEKTVPDVAFVGYPPIETASVFSTWLVKRNVPFILDVRDLWPSVFLEAMPAAVRVFGGLILTPYFMLAKDTIKRATGISAMADSFLERVLKLGGRKKSSLDRVFPLTSTVNSATASALAAAEKWWTEFGLQEDAKFRVFYVGNLSSNVDLKPVKDAAIFFMKHRTPVEFMICGDGVSLETFKKMMAGLDNVHFPGRIDQVQMLSLASHCKAALIPYVNSENFQLSLPNKTLDALSLGLPIFSSLQGEVASLISEHKVGMSYGPATQKSLQECIEFALKESAYLEKMAQNALNLYQEKFSFPKIYGDLVVHLEMLVKTEVMPQI